MVTYDRKKQLGIGLIGIGREWGHVSSSIPDERTALELLEFAFEMGISFFDTAASYGLSEKRLGKFLSTLTPSERSSLTIATKFGEHWDFDRQQPYVDHSYHALCASLDRSLGCLGQIDLLQLHKASPAVLKSEDLARAWEYAHQQGILNIGASVNEIDGGHLAIFTPELNAIQLPYNIQNAKFEEVIDLAAQNNKLVIINRPFNSGKIFGMDKVDTQIDQEEAFRFIFRKEFTGVILSGTKSISHLKDNWEAYFKASINKDVNGMG